jgi:hypothetical protein
LAALISVVLPAALGIALAIIPISARAETKVRGTPQSVVVEAANAPLEEVLAALTDNFNVRFLSAANLDKRLTGTYRGTLQQALSHILKGCDIVVKSSQAGGLEVTLRGVGKPVAVVGGLPVPTSGGPTPPIRTALLRFRHYQPLARRQARRRNSGLVQRLHRRPRNQLSGRRQSIGCRPPRPRLDRHRRHPALASPE